jgi:hypothetical protein
MGGGGLWLAGAGECSLRRMDGVLTLLAVVGIAVTVLRVVGSTTRVLREGLDGYLAGELSRVRAQRGDLTGMAEARQVRRQARNRRRLQLARTGGWLLLLGLPLLTPWTRAVYASYAVGWAVLRVWRGVRV